VSKTDFLRAIAMNDVTHILSQIESGDPSAANQLLPLVYEELRRLAAQKLAQEKPGQTLQATSLVHEAFLRLVNQHNIAWQSRELRVKGKGGPHGNKSKQRAVPMSSASGQRS
jgi:hypothetical protein